MVVMSIAMRRPMAFAAAHDTAAARPPVVAAAARPAFDIRPSQLREELERAAWLRADAYYEERSVGRFKASFVKQFAGQELYSLLRRTQGQQPECLAFVATRGGGSSSSSSVAAGAGDCIGTLDVRLLDPGNLLTISSWPDGVPKDSGGEHPTAAAAAAPSAYVSNVVVAPAQRGRRLGHALVAAGLAAAREQWGAVQVYCHVETDNEAALALYRGSGFTQLGEELPATEMGLGGSTPGAGRLPACLVGLSAHLLACMPACLDNCLHG